MNTRPPTPQGISRLLAKAGFERAVIKIRGGTSGFDVHTDYSTGNVKVEHYSQVSNGYSEVKLAAYARAIADAGYEVLKPSPRWLIVTAGPEDSSLLAAKEADPR